MYLQFHNELLYIGLVTLRKTVYNQPVLSKRTCCTFLCKMVVLAREWKTSPNIFLKHLFLDLTVFYLYSCESICSHLVLDKDLEVTAGVCKQTPRARKHFLVWPPWFSQDHICNDRHRTIGALRGRYWQCLSGIITKISGCQVNTFLPTVLLKSINGHKNVTCCRHN